MAQQYSRELLRRTAAQVCQLVGWHAVQSSSLDVLVHALEQFILTLAERTHRLAEHLGRTDPILTDLAYAFAELGVRPDELREFARCVPPCPLPFAPPEFPLPRQPSLNFLKPGSREVLTRPVHVHEHLPPMLPEEPPAATPDPPPSPGPPKDDSAQFKRPPEPPQAKRPKPRPVDDFQTRELSSVMMTVSGFLSPAREGRLPEARTPIAHSEPPPPRSERLPSHPRPPERIERPERPDKKSKRSKIEGKPDKKKKEKTKHPNRSKNHLADIPQPKLFAPDIPTEVIKREPDIKPKLFMPPTINVADLPPDVPLPMTATVKEEKPDNEKLSSQPDRLKLNIFKKISTKIKEEKPSELPECLPPEGVTIKVERPSPEPMDESIEVFSDLPPPYAPHENPHLVVVPPRRPEPPLDVDFEAVRQKIKREPIDEPIPEPPRPKLSVIPHEILTGSLPENLTPKERKELKRREQKLTEERAMKKYRKLVKQAELQKKAEAAAAAAAAAASAEPDPVSPAFPYFQLPPNMVPNFSNLISGPGLIPGGGMFPNPNPALRGISMNPNLLANPYSMRIPDGAPFLPSGPGLIPQGGFPPFNMNRIRPPQMTRPPEIPSYLRRPSLEVIPIEEEVEPKIRPKHPLPEPVFKEKDKPKNLNFLANNANMTITPVKTTPSPLPSPATPFPQIKPDVTIQLNTPDRPKIEYDPTPMDASEDLSVVKDKSDKKKDKLHKKEKKDKELKIKKKKDKKDKLKLKLERKREKEEKQELKERIKKEKKEKRKEKERQQTFGNEGIVPKITLKLGPSSPMLPPSPETTKTLNIKPVVRKDEPPPSPNRSSSMSEDRSPGEQNQSPELAKISALFTRPPKIKTKHGKEQPIESTNPSQSPPLQLNNSSPGRKSRPPYAKYKRIYFKPIPKRNSSDFEDPIIDLAAEEVPEPEPIPETSLNAPYYIDPQGNQIWICPACSHPDNGTPMIGCDGGCDAWYHWACVGIHVAPDDAEDWYCTGCNAKRAAQASAQAGHSGKKRGRKPKADKMKERVN